MENSVLYKKILQIQKSAKPPERSGYNEYKKYSYETASDIFDPIRNSCNQAGILVTFSVIDKTISPGRASVMVKLSLIDIETGEKIESTAPGYGEDWSYKDDRPIGDKAVYKAITGATKYAIKNLFFLPTSDDPEKTQRTTKTNNYATKKVASTAYTADSEIAF